AMLPALDTALRNLDVAAIFVAESGCPPLPGAVVSFQGRENWRCRRFNRDVLQLLADSPRFEEVVLVAAWNSYAVENQGYKLRAAASDTSADSMRRGLTQLTRELKQGTAIQRIII